MRHDIELLNIEHSKNMLLTELSIEIFKLEIQKQIRLKEDRKKKLLNINKNEKIFET